MEDLHGRLERSDHIAMERRGGAENWKGGNEGMR